MPWVVPKGQPPLGLPVLGHLQHNQGPLPRPAPLRCTHIRSLSNENVVACIPACATQTRLLSELTGRASMLHNSSGGPARGLMCAEHGRVHMRSDSRCSTECSETHTYTRKHMPSACVLLCIQVSRDTIVCSCTHSYHPGSAQPQSYVGSGPGPTGSETASSQQAPATVLQAQAAQLPSQSRRSPRCPRSQPDSVTGGIPAPEPLPHQS